VSQQALSAAYVIADTIVRTVELGVTMIDARRRSRSNPAALDRTCPGLYAPALT
jgi:hypothetical protein